MCTYTYTNKQTHKQIGIKVNIIQTSKVRSSLVRRDQDQDEDNPNWVRIIQKT